MWLHICRLLQQAQNENSQLLVAVRNIEYSAPWFVITSCWFQQPAPTISSQSQKPIFVSIYDSNLFAWKFALLLLVVFNSIHFNVTITYARYLLVVLYHLNFSNLQNNSHHRVFNSNVLLSVFKRTVICKIHFLNHFQWSQKSSAHKNYNQIFI